MSDPNVVMMYFDVSFKSCSSLFLQETSFNSRMIQKKAWFFRQKQLKVPSTKIRGKGATIMGTISKCLPNNGYFQIVEKTSKICFMEYLNNLREQILPEFRAKKLIFLLDNHSAHRGPDQRALLGSFCVHRFIPPYSCELSKSIFWSNIFQICLLNATGHA